MDIEPLVIMETHPKGVLELALNRPQSLNALSLAFVGAISGAVNDAAASHPTVVVVTSRCARAFSVGADLKERSVMSAEELLASRAHFVAAYRSLLELPMPVVVAINGFTVGGGLELALTCDLIVADQSVVVGLPEVTIGLIPGGGGTQLLSRRTGWGPAADLILTGRRLHGPEAQRLGLVDRLVVEGQARRAALELADTVASASPVSLLGAKHALRGGWSLSLSDGLALEDEVWRAVATSDDRAEGIRAFVEKRPARWPSSVRSI